MPVYDARTFAEAYRIASRVISMALGCIVPALIGYLLDRWLSISPAGVTIGSLLGFLSMVFQIRSFAAESSTKRPKP